MAKKTDRAKAASPRDQADADGRPVEINNKQLEDARRNPEVKRFLAEAFRRDAQLHREGLIHP